MELEGGKEMRVQQMGEVRWLRILEIRNPKNQPLFGLRTRSTDMLTLSGARLGCEAKGANLTSRLRVPSGE